MVQMEASLCWMWIGGRVLAWKAAATTGGKSGSNAGNGAKAFVGGWELLGAVDRIVSGRLLFRLYGLCNASVR